MWPFSHGIQGHPNILLPSLADERQPVGVKPSYKAHFSSDFLHFFPFQFYIFQLIRQQKSTGNAASLYNGWPTVSVCRKRNHVTGPRVQIPSEARWPLDHRRHVTRWFWLITVIISFFNYFDVYNKFATRGIAGGCERVNEGYTNASFKIIKSCENHELKMKNGKIHGSTLIGRGSKKGKQV